MKKGFTLIELLVVIAIIGILATVIILNVSNARGKAQTAKAKENGAQVTKIANACISFNGTIGGPTDATTGGGNVCATAPTGQDLTDSAGSTTGAWPDLTSTGYAYGTLTSSATAFDFTLTKSGSATVTCNQNGCN